MATLEDLRRLFDHEGEAEQSLKPLNNSTNCFTGFPSKFRAASRPFSHCVIEGFLGDGIAVQKLENHILGLEYNEKDNDLYKFVQTKALEKSDDEPLRHFREQLFKLKDSLSELFQTKLTGIDMFAAQYKYTDTLLCHDDELEGRRVAYIYYLVPDDWTGEDGGGLSLFERDPDTKLPTTVCQSIVPKRDSLAFFEVTSKSYHQVAEVLTQSKTRLSLTGWFHGIPAKREVVSPDTPIIYRPPGDIDEGDFYKSINTSYLDLEVQLDIREQFSDSSEIQLNDFVPDEIYQTLTQEIKSDRIVWIRRGPANKRWYSIADATTLPKSIQDLVSLLTSDAMLLTISNLTNLKLHPLAQVSDDESESEGEEPEAKRSKGGEASTSSSSATSKPKASTEPQEPGDIHVEVRRWQHGDYTLLHDNDLEQGHEYALDAFLYFHSKEWAVEMGGGVIYVAKNDEETLLQIEPVDNSLALVYRDAETLRFVKHINQTFSNRDNNMPYMYSINLIYRPAKG